MARVRAFPFDIRGKLPQTSRVSASIRLNDDLIAAAKRQAALLHRSPPQQIEHWAAIGRVMEAALSYPAQEQVVAWGSARDLEALRAGVESDAGRARAKRVIRRTAGTLVTTDRNPQAKRNRRNG